MKTLITVCIVFAAVIGLFLGYMGFFVPGRVTEAVTGPYVAAVESFVGDYKDVGPVFIRVSEGLQRLGLNAKQGIGIFYDDPRTVAKKSLRSDCGFILEGPDFIKIVEIRKKYKIVNLLAKPSIIIEFPIKNAMSYMLGAMRSYPILTRYLKQNKYRLIAAYELYDTPAKKIQYVFQVEKE